MRRVREAIKQSAVAAAESRQDASNTGQRRGSTSATPQELSSLQQTRVCRYLLYLHARADPDMGSPIEQKLGLVIAARSSLPRTRGRAIT